MMSAHGVPTKTETLVTITRDNYSYTVSCPAKGESSAMSPELVVLEVARYLGAKAPYNGSRY